MYNGCGKFFYYPTSLFNQDKAFTLIDITFFEKGSKLKRK